jgi:AraC family ethanolamine operon transcriptional activator
MRQEVIRGNQSSGATADAIHACNVTMLGRWHRARDPEMALFDAATKRQHAQIFDGDEAVLFNLRFGVSFRASFRLPAGWSAIGYIRHAPSGNWYQGISLDLARAFLLQPRDLNDVMLKAGTVLSMVLVPCERVRRSLPELQDAMGDVSWLPHFFSLSGSLIANCLQSRFRDLAQSLGDDSGPLSSRLLTDTETDSLLASYLGAAMSALPADRPVCTRTRRAHYLVVRRAEDYMRAHLHTEIYLGDIGKATGVSDRSVRYAFTELLGMSPTRYLSMLRLSAACKRLSCADGSQHSVKSIALDCGLWDLSRFADSYRRLFGELPRDTLMRPPVAESLLVGNY